jgi:hypothetical protein
MHMKTQKILGLLSGALLLMTGCGDKNPAQEVAVESAITPG